MRHEAKRSKYDSSCIGTRLTGVLKNSSVESLVDDAKRIDIGSRLMVVDPCSDVDAK